MTQTTNGLRLKRSCDHSKYCYVKGCTNKPLPQSWLCQKHVKSVLMLSPHTIGNKSI